MAQPVHLEPVPIPEALHELLVARLGEREVSSWATEAVVVESARQGLISRRKAATLLGIQDPSAREEFFERHGLILEYTAEMLEEDFKTIDKFCK